MARPSPFGARGRGRHVTNNGWGVGLLSRGVPVTLHCSRRSPYAYSPGEHGRRWKNAVSCHNS